jgi:phospholipid/cholesterol/gamma-HCH transport system substrate-binding protein
MKGLLALAALMSLLAGGCSSSLPLPGAAPAGPAYRVVVEFADVLDLVPQSAVKVNDVTVGSVEEIWLAGWTARVRVRIADHVHLPDNATAAIRQTSLLGEKFVSLDAPAGEPAQGSLSDGDVIPLARTRRSAEVEEVLGALGLLLNGGGLGQIKTINEELAAALEGHEADAQAALRSLDQFIAGLDAQRDEITRAIDGLDRLSARLSAQRATIGAAVDALGPGLRVLAQQRAQLTAALTALGELGKVGNRVVTASRDDTLASIKALRPTLDQLVRAGDTLPKAMDFLLTYPFPPNITGAITSDRVNLHVTADLDASQILANLLAAAPPAAGGTQLPNLPTLPTVPLPTLPPLPLPTLTLPVPTPSLSLPVPLPPLPSLPGLPIAAGSAPAGAAEATIGPLDRLLAGGLSA